MLREWLDRRRELGQDGFDEIWDGVYHVAPVAHGRQGATDEELTVALHSRARAAGLRGSGPVNVGGPGNHRARVHLRSRKTALWNPTAAIVVEIISPDDESRQEFGFHFDAGVEAMLLVDPRERTVEWFVRGDTAFVATDRSALLDVSTAELIGEIEWPD